MCTIIANKIIRDFVKKIPKNYRNKVFLPTGQLVPKPKQICWLKPETYILNLPANKYTSTDGWTDRQDNQWKNETSLWKWSLWNRIWICFLDSLAMVMCKTLKCFIIVNYPVVIAFDTNCLYRQDVSRWTSELVYTAVFSTNLMPGYYCKRDTLHWAVQHRSLEKTVDDPTNVKKEDYNSL